MHRDKIRGRHKYNAKRVEYDGHKFDSKREANRYHLLKALERQGQIFGLKLHERYPLFTRDKNGQQIPIKIRGPKGGLRQAFYTPDFEYTDDKGKVIIEDVKSPATMTEASKLRIAIFEACYEVEVKYA